MNCTVVLALAYSSLYTYIIVPNCHLCKVQNAIETTLVCTLMQHNPCLPNYLINSCLCLSLQYSYERKGWHDSSYFYVTNVSCSLLRICNYCFSLVPAYYVGNILSFNLHYIMVDALSMHVRVKKYFQLGVFVYCSLDGVIETQSLIGPLQNYVK